MGKCKNIECDNETENKKIYCSLTCRNYYVNKYLRDYKLNSKGLVKITEDVYNLNPNKCLNCDCNLSYDKRKNKYCSKSCGVSINNKNKLGKTKNLSNAGLEKIRKSNVERNYHIHGFTYNEYYDNPNKCCECGVKLEFAKRNTKFCSKLCFNNFRRKNMEDFLKYKQDASFKFNLNKFPNEFDFSLIEEYGWYSPKNSKKPNLMGVSRDHMFSIKEGFENNVDPKLLSHPANCKLMQHNDNISKNKNSSITIEELIERINKWELLYKSV